MDLILGMICGYLACGAFIVCKVAASTWNKYAWRNGPAAFVASAILAVFVWPRLISDEVQ